MQQEAGSMGNERVTLHLPKAHSPHPLASFHRLLRKGIHWTRCPNLQSELPPFSLKNQQVASLKPTRSTIYCSLACNTDRTSNSSDCLSVTCQFCFSLLNKKQAPVMPHQPVTQETSPSHAASTCYTRNKPQSCRINLLHKKQAPVMPHQPVTQETSPSHAASTCYTRNKPQSCRINLLHKKQAPVMPHQPVTQETSPSHAASTCYTRNKPQSCCINLSHTKCHPFCLWATEQATPLQPVTPITPITPLQPVTPVTPITPPSTCNTRYTNHPPSTCNTRYTII